MNTALKGIPNDRHSGNSPELSISFEKEQHLSSKSLSPSSGSSSLCTSPRLRIPGGKSREYLELKERVMSVDDEAYLEDAPPLSTIPPTPSSSGANANSDQRDLELELNLENLNLDLNNVPYTPPPSSPRSEQANLLHTPPHTAASGGGNAHGNRFNFGLDLGLNNVSHPLTPPLRSKQSSCTRTTPLLTPSYGGGKVRGGKMHGRDIGLEMSLDNLNLGLTNFSNSPPLNSRPTQSGRSHNNVKGYTRKPYERPPREQSSSSKSSFYGSFMNPDRLLALALNDLQPATTSTLYAALCLLMMAIIINI